MDGQCIYLGIKVKPGPIERFKLENYGLENTVDNLKGEAEKKSNVPSTSLEIIHHGKILKDKATLLESGVKHGEMVHVLKKKENPPPAQRPTYTDAELQQLNTSLRALGCTPNAPGWTRAMQLLNDENVMNEIYAQAPSLADDCVALSILHEVELLAALGSNIQTMRSGAEAHPELPAALRHLTRLEQTRPNSATAADAAALSGFAYSLEALSEEEEEEDADLQEEDRPPITQHQLAAALQAATGAASSPRNSDSGRAFLRLLRHGAERRSEGNNSTAGERALITPEMFSEAISEAISRAGTTTNAPAAAGTNIASSSQGGAAGAHEFSAQLSRMHEMGLLDDAVNLRALLICSGDVNGAINLVFSGAIGDD